MATTFSIPRLTAERLSRLGLACAVDAGPLGHIALRVTPTAVRFAATNGRILASLLVPLEQLDGDPLDLVLDREQLTAALKSTTKAGAGRVTFEIGAQETRISNGPTAALVRRTEGSFPQIEHVWTRPAGRRWIPTISTLDPHLVAIAQKVAGLKVAMLFSSPVDPSIRLERLWAVPGAPLDETISVADLRVAVSAPAYWADHELALLLMPITRSDGERQLDLSEHALPIPMVAPVELDETVGVAA